MTSLWTRWLLKSPASRLFTQPSVQAPIKENMKAPSHWPVTRKIFPFDDVIMHAIISYPGRDRSCDKTNNTKLGGGNVRVLPFVSNCFSRNCSSSAVVSRPSLVRHWPSSARSMTPFPSTSLDLKISSYTETRENLDVTIKQQNSGDQWYHNVSLKYRIILML